MPHLSEKLGKLKLSNFVFKTKPYIDPIDGASKRILLSTVSGEAVLVEEEVASLIEEGEIPEIPEPFLEKLIKNKLLVDKSQNELEVIIDENREADNDPSFLKVVIQPTNSCQMGCTQHYCGQTHGKQKLTSSRETQILNRIEHQLKKKGRKTLQVGWFGAEPITGIRSIRNLTPKIMGLTQKHGVNYRAMVVSNGISLFPKIFDELTQELGVTRIEVTLDGDESTHDLRRHTKTGQKTFSHIWKNLDAILKKESAEGVISIRSNIDKSNTDAAFRLIDKIAAAGWREKIHSYYVAPVHAWGNEASTEMTQQEFASFEARVFAHMLQKGFSVPLLPSRLQSACTATHKDHELIDAFGEVHNCTETSYVKAYETGNDITGTVNRHAIGKLSDSNQTLDQRASENSLSQFTGKLKELPCSSCFLLPSCGGGCPKLWEEGISPCPPAKFNMEERLLLAWASKRLEQSKKGMKVG